MVVDDDTTKRTNILCLIVVMSTFLRVVLSEANHSTFYEIEKIENLHFTSRIVLF